MNLPHIGQQSQTSQEPAAQAPTAPAPVATSPPSKPVQEVTTPRFSSIQEALLAAAKQNSITTPPATIEQKPEQTPAEDQAPAKEAVPAQEEQAPKPKSKLLTEMEALGFVDVSEQDAADRLLEWAKTQARQPQAPAPQAQQPTAPATQPVQPKQPKNEVPFHLNDLRLSEDEESLVEQFRETITDDSGKEITRWSKDAPIELRRRVEQIARHRAEYQEALLTRPMEVFEAINKHMVQPMVQQQVQAALGQIQAQQQENELFRSSVESNRWMMQIDPRTNQPVIDPRDGLPVFSDAGNRVLDHMDMLERYPPNKRWELAISLTKAEMGIQDAPPPQQPQAPAQPTLADLEAQRRENQQNLLRSQMASLPNSGQSSYQAGTLPTTNGMPHRAPDGSMTSAPPRSQNPSAGLGEKFMAAMGYQPQR